MCPNLAAHANTDAVLQIVVVRHTCRSREQRVERTRVHEPAPCTIGGLVVAVAVCEAC